MKFIIDTSLFFPHQREWWNLPNFIKLLVGGYGCGKTYIGALRSIYLSYVNRGIMGMYVSPTYTMAEKTIIPTLYEIFRRSYINFEHNKKSNLFKIHNWNGSFWIGSGDNPDSLRGPNLAWAGIDEPFIQDKAVFDQMLARVRAGEKREIFLTGTPEELNWGYDLYVNDGNKYDIGTVFGKTKDNTVFPKHYYETMYNAYSEEMRDAYLEGKFINLRAGKVYKPFDREKHVKHIDIDPKTVEICAGVDFNVDYMTAEIFYKGNDWMHFFDEIRLSFSNTFELAEKLGANYPGIKIYPDPSGGARKTSSSMTDHSILQQAGFYVKSVRETIPLKDRINSVNKMLLNNKLTIEPGRCPWLIKDFERVSWDQGDLNKKDDPALTHASDAAGYAVYYLFPAKIKMFGGVYR